MGEESLGLRPRLNFISYGENMSDGGKGSKSRPFSVDLETFDDNWDRIFSKAHTKAISDKMLKQIDESITRNEYQDILSTEDCVLDALKKTT